MARNYKLSWQKGINGRRDRWRKKYKGRIHYFDGGRGKSDRLAYEAALSAWEAKKVEIDRDAPRPHQREYENAIDTWEQVLAWSNQHGDEETAKRAAKKLEHLRRRLTESKLPPLPWSDQFESTFDTPDYGIDWKPLDRGAESESRGKTVVRLPPSPELDGSPERIQHEVWSDRLASLKRTAAPVEESIQAQVEHYLKQLENNAHAGEISAGRVNAVRLHLQFFKDWLGKDGSVNDINTSVLIGFREHLLKKVKAKTWTAKTAKHYLASIKSFMQWLYETNEIATLPRVMQGKSKILTIKEESPKIVTFTKDEITTLLKEATGRTKLFILLMLNCGMTQKDIADLTFDEVDWDEGRIIRKRSKTSDHANVPVVNYKLWGEAFELLKKERAAGSTGLVLLNANGSPLWTEANSPDGKYQKTDNIKNAFDRLKKGLDIKKSLKSLKKTSASLLRNHEQFSGLESLFLGHAPTSMSDKHYTKAPQTLLDNALQWLGQEYGLGKSKPEAEEQPAPAVIAEKSPQEPPPPPPPPRKKR